MHVVPDTQACEAAHWPHFGTVPGEVPVGVVVVGGVVVGVVVGGLVVVGGVVVGGVVVGVVVVGFEPPDVPSVEVRVSTESLQLRQVRLQVVRTRDLNVGTAGSAEGFNSKDLQNRRMKSLANVLEKVRICSLNLYLVVVIAWLEAVLGPSVEVVGNSDRARGTLVLAD